MLSPTAAKDAIAPAPASDTREPIHSAISGLPVHTLTVARLIADSRPARLSWVIGPRRGRAGGALASITTACPEPCPPAISISMTPRLRTRVIYELLSIQSPSASI